jgi:UPF0271 protein
VVWATSVDVNADLGEGLGAAAEDSELVRLVTTTHIACGFHAGDPSTMRRTVAAAVAAGTVVGAHPSYPDRVGFGRRALDVAAEQVADDVAYQIGALDGIARTAGTRVRSVKAHGALYHRMAVDEECCAAVAGAVAGYGADLCLVVPAGSAAETVATAAGVPVVTEAFCDRAYRGDGTLVPRGLPGALLIDPQAAAHQAVSLATKGRVATVDGTTLTLAAATLCVHGDTPGAPAIVTAVRRALEQAGVRVEAVAPGPPG